MTGLVAVFLRGDWQKARGFDKLILLGPLFYAGPIAVMERATLKGLNYAGDTLMYCGVVLLLAGAMPREGAEAFEQHRTGTIAIEEPPRVTRDLIS